jgi:peptide/nickel transport system permease protein
MPQQIQELGQENKIIMSKSPTYRHMFSKLKKSKTSYVAFCMLLFIFFMALFADLIATDQPWYVKYKGKTYYPAFSQLINPTRLDTITDPFTNAKEILQFDLLEWRSMETDAIVFAPIPYSPGKPDKLNRDYVGPRDEQKMKLPDGTIVKSTFRFRHHLGTDQVGNDLLSTLIHGSRLALQVGLISIFIASVIGISLGALAGYFGDKKLKISRGAYYLLIAGIFPAFFYAFIFRSAALSWSFELGYLNTLYELSLSLIIFISILTLFFQLGRLLKVSSLFSAKTNVPVDSIVSRLIEIMNSLPRILIIITIAAIFKDKSLGLVITIIGLTSWTGIARFTRAEMMRQSQLEYIEAARAMGIPGYKIILKHALPNAFAPVMIEIAFSIASAILLESGLSFLGIGVPDDVSTWGAVLSSGRQQFDAWWLVIFPGLAIFITVTSFNLLGDWLRDIMNPKNK